MPSFSSSVINKSGRKFAPKVPVRRGGPNAAAQPPRKAGSDVQASPQPQQQSQPAAVQRTTAPIAAENSEAGRSSSILTDTTELPSARPRQPSRPASRDKHAVPIPVPVVRRSDSSTAAPQRSPSASHITASSRSPEAIARPSTAEASSPLGSRSQSHNHETSKHSVDFQQQTDRLDTSTTRSHAATESRARPENDVDARPAKRARITEPATPRPSTRTGQPTSETQQRNVPEKSSGESASGPHIGRPRGGPRRSTGTTAPDEAVADAAQDKKPQRRKREVTPENAESTEIVSGVVTMAELCKDVRIGKKSRREMELQNMDGAEAARKRKEKENRRKKENTEEQRNESGDTPATTAAAGTGDSAPAGGPKLKIINGEIVLDTTSLQIDRHADADRSAGDMRAVEENPLTRRINSSSFGKRAKAESWDAELTELFYRGLRMFGTDFMMISKMFPGRTRRHIKLKFSNEERRHPERIHQALVGPRESVSLEDYADMTNTRFDDPRVVEQELAEDKRKIEEQHAQEKEAREELLLNPVGDSNVLPSIENGDKDNT